MPTTFGPTTSIAVLGIAVAATLLYGFLSLILKGQKRSICLNLLLVTATVTAVFAGIMWSKLNQTFKITSFVSMPVTFNADLLQCNLFMATSASYEDEEFPYLRVFPTKEALTKFQQSLFQYSQRYLESLLQRYPDNEELIVRLCLVAEESGGDACAEMSKRAHFNDHSKLLSVFDQIFCGDKNKLTQADKAMVEDCIVNNFPPGWYRQSALLAAYRRLGDQIDYKAVLAERRNATRSQVWKILVCLAYLLVVQVLGAIILCRSALGLVKGTWDNSRFVQTLTFRSIYGIVLFSVYFEVIVASAICKLTEHLKLPVSLTSHNLLADLLGTFCLLIGVVLSINLFLVKTGRLRSIADLFSVGSEKRPLLILKMGFYGYCVAAFGTFCVNAVANLCGHPFSSDTSIIRHLMALSIYPEPMTIVISIVAAAIVAPIAEEIIFRGLLYAWLRKRLRPIAAALISGLLFAAVHHDLGGFVPLAIVGIVLAMVFERSGTLWAAIITHGLFNLTSTIWLLVLSPV